MNTKAQLEDKNTSASKKTKAAKPAAPKPT